MSADGTVAPVRPHRLALVFSVALASSIGMAPFTLMLHMPVLLVALTGLAMIGAAIGIRSFKTAATEKPGFLEYLFGTVGALRLPAGAGLLCFVMYGFVYGLFFALGWVTEWLGWTRPDPETYAWYTGAGMAGFYVLLMASVTVRRLAEQLYPDVGGVRSAFFSVMTLSKWVVWNGTAFALLVLGGYVLVLWLTDVSVFTWWLNLLLTIAIGGLSAPLEKAGRMHQQPPEETRAVEAVKRLFEASGYESVTSPRTGEPTIDPLLVNLNLLAVGADNAFAIDVEAPSTPKSRASTKVDSGQESESLRLATHLSEDLPTAAWAIDEFLHRDTESPMPTVTPMVVVVGREVSPLERFIWDRADIRTGKIPNGMVEKILKLDDEEKLRGAAQQYLDIPRSSVPEAASRD